MSPTPSTAATPRCLDSPGRSAAAFAAATSLLAVASPGGKGAFLQPGKQLGGSGSMAAPAGVGSKAEEQEEQLQPHTSCFAALAAFPPDRQCSAAEAAGQEQLAWAPEAAGREQLAWAADLRAAHSSLVPTTDITFLTKPDGRRMSLGAGASGTV